MKEGNKGEMNANSKMHVGLGGVVVVVVSCVYIRQQSVVHWREKERRGENQ